MPHVLRNSFGHPYLTISHEPENNWIRNEWTGVLSVDSVMQGAQAVLDEMRRTGCQYLLNDNRAVVGSWNQANDWIATTWMPQALALGLRRFAHLVAPGTFVQASAEEMRKRAADRFAMELFADADEGAAWLRAAQVAAPPAEAPITDQAP